MTRWEEWANKHVDMRALHDPEWTRKGPARHPDRVCVGCREEFTPRHGQQIWCTPACRDKSRHRRAREKEKKAQKQRDAENQSLQS
jgi:hypothetical protein